MASDRLIEPLSSLNVERDPLRRTLSGVQAVPRLLSAQHHLDVQRGLHTSTFVSGYPGSPLAGLDQAIARYAEREVDEIHLVPGMNEELAATSVWGSQLQLPGRPPGRSAVGAWFGKSPGLDRAMDPIRHGNLVGANPNGGVLLLVGDDPSCKSSSIPSASEATLASLPVPVLVPRSSAELVTFGLSAIEISRRTGFWVALKIVAEVADGVWQVDDEHFRSVTVVPEFEWMGEAWTYHQGGHAMPPSSHEAEAAMLGPRWQALNAIANASPFDQIEVNPEQASIGFVATGTTFDQVTETLHALGLGAAELDQAGVRLLRVGLPFPLASRTLREFSRGLDTVVVVEDKAQFLEQQVKGALYASDSPPVVLGSYDHTGRVLIPSGGALTVGRLTGPFRRLLEERVPLPTPPRERIPLPILTAQRTPYLCSGCPHNKSTAVPEGSLAAGGIGCHGMVVRMPHLRDVMTGITQMGGEGAQWIGQSRFHDTPHLFQNIGDGTFAHSGQLAVQACIAAGVNITFKVLYNGAIAMTGAQDVPGGLSVPALTRKLHAEGVRRTIVCSEDPSSYGRRAGFAPGVDVWSRDRLDEAQTVLRDTEGVTVIIYDQACAAEARRLRKRGKLPQKPMRVVINESICEGCGDCGVKSNCLSVEPIDTVLGRKTQINQSTCNTDYSCLDGDCPSFVTLEIDPDALPRETAQRPTAPEVPQPELPQIDGTFNLFLAGVGGTGVITANRLLAVAADLDGLVASGTDQLGSSQKAGAVTSQLRLSRGALQGASLIPPGAADSLIGFDLIASASDRTLESTGTSRTRAVVCDAVTPTGEMVRNVNHEPPRVADLVQRIAAATREVTSVDAPAVAKALFGTEEQTNIVVLGAAFQLGLVPITAVSIEAAIGLNGVAVEANIEAFRWGRATVADAPTVADLVDHRTPAEATLLQRRGTEALEGSGLSGPVREIAIWRLGHLLDYDRHSAGEYRRLLDAAWLAERRLGDETRFTAAAAEGLYRVMAYKDEYEVARLLASDSFDATLRDQFPDARRVRYRLHPPLLRSLGMKRKLAVPRAARPALRALAAGRRLRGTRFDPFGYSAMRRAERELRDSFIADVVVFTSSLSAQNYQLACEMLEAVDEVRGYEGVKLANLERYHSRVSALRSQLPSRSSD
jgi:indolepyruvate ferredoxin oxidoreductase